MSRIITPEQLRPGQIIRVTYTDGPIAITETATVRTAGDLRVASIPGTPNAGTTRETVLTHEDTIELLHEPEPEGLWSTVAWDDGQGGQHCAVRRGDKWHVLSTGRRRMGEGPYSWAQVMALTGEAALTIHDTAETTGEVWP